VLLVYRQLYCAIGPYHQSGASVKVSGAMHGRAGQADRKIERLLKGLAGTQTPPYVRITNSLNKLRDENSQLAAIMQSRKDARLLATSTYFDDAERLQAQYVSESKKISDNVERLRAQYASESKKISGVSKTEYALSLSTQKTMRTLRAMEETRNRKRDALDAELLDYAQRLIMLATDAPFDLRRARAFLSVGGSIATVLVGTVSAPVGALASFAQMLAQLKTDLPGAKIKEDDRRQQLLAAGQKVVDSTCELLSMWIKTLNPQGR
jgi:hypothetical protein